MQKTTISLLTFRRRQLSALLAVTAFGFVCAGPAAAQVRNVGGFTVLSVPSTGGPQGNVDFVRAKTMKLPTSSAPTDQTPFLVSSLISPPARGTSGSTAGSQGTGVMNHMFLGVPEAADEDGSSPLAFGTTNHPFSTARADLDSGGVTATNRTYPYRAAGKLFFKIGVGSYICSAALIKRGIAVTAAHCVADYGKSQFYNSWQFIPGYRNGNAPFGTWTVNQVWVKTSYFNGTDGCFQFGVICPNDVAVLILNPSATGAYAGASTGWLGYGWGNFGFAGSQTHITQLGYPSGLDNAKYMERNDSSGFTNVTYSNNTIIGSNMDGGSSGGPWVVNFGIPPVLTGETSGSAANPNIVVGVTSWGSISKGPKEQGASPFTSNNIVSLVNSACGAVPAACL